MLSRDNYSCASSRALADIMTEAYSDLKSGEKCEAKLNTVYLKKFKSLKERIYSGKN